MDQELLLLSFLFTCSLVVAYVMIKMEEYYEHPEHNIEHNININIDVDVVNDLGC